MDFESFINEQKYLLDYQRKKLVEEYTEYCESSKQDASLMWDILDSILFKMLEINKYSLSPAEKLTINQVLKEYGYE